MLIKVYLWCLMGMGIYWLARKFTFDRKTWIASLFLHLVLSLMFAAGHSYLYAITAVFLSNIGVMALDGSFKVLFILSYRFNFTIYWTILSFCVAVEYFRKYKHKEIKTAELAAEKSLLEAQLVTAQLQALRMQLQPHFLFNTLHTINGLMFENVNAASKMLTKLSDLLRISLETSTKKEINLKSEIDFIETYLNIQKERFKDRLTVEYQIQQETFAALVPPLILQPIVENAVNHGVAKKRKDAKIEIRSNIFKEYLMLEVRDNGKGFNVLSVNESGTGVGLQNTLNRLQQLYPENHNFDIVSAPKTGTVVTIKLPFKTNGIQH